MKAISACCLCLIMAVWSPLLFASDTNMPDWQSTLQALDRRGGWVVHAGTSDGVLEATVRQLPETEFVVTGLAYSSEAAVGARQYLRQQGIYGSVTIHEVIQTERLPMPTDSVALLLVNTLCLPRQHQAMKKSSVYCDR